MWKQVKSIFGGNTDNSADAPGDENPPSPERLADCYRDLNVPEGADLNTVRRAWKAALKQVHLDHYSDDLEKKKRAQEKANRINDAYRTLQDHLF